jgi:hypothetical protein
MTTLLTQSHRLDDVRAPGQYVLPSPHGTRLLTVVAALDADNQGFVVQTLLCVDDGAEYVRVRTPKGSWTEWAKRLYASDSLATKDFVQKLLGGAVEGVPLEDASEASAGLMSSDAYLKLKGIEEGATGDQTAEEVLALLKDAKLDAATLGGRSPCEYASKDHEHGQYVTASMVRDALLHFVPLETFTPDNFAKLVEMVAKRINVGAFAGADEYVRRSDLTAELLLDILGKLDAATLGGKAADEFAAREHAHEEYAPRKQIAKKHTANQGSVKGEFVPNPERGTLQRIANVGDILFKAPSLLGDYEMKVLIVNGPNAGVVEFKGFSNELEWLPSSAGKYLVEITKLGEVTLADVRVVGG